jgi:hypothetical protein
MVEEMEKGITYFCKRAKVTSKKGDSERGIELL